MFGFENKEELTHFCPVDISPDVQPDGQKSSEKSKEMIRIAFEKGVNRFEWTHRRKNGEIISTEVLLSAFEYGGELVLQSTVQDITNRKIAEEHIKKSLHEKEVLLKEVHHRVKNNLQIISSILNLQSATITDQNTLDLLKNSQNRIRSMSLIHELLYQTKDFSTINFSEYIVSISTNLFQSYNQNKNTKLTLELDPLFLDLDIAIPCGLIINELVTNSLKYSFDINQTNGEVKIQLSQKEDEVLLKIEDNGKGFPNDIDFRDTESLGMQLVVSLIDQIDGEIILENTSGAKYELRFKNVSRVSERLN
jgi:two-component sensor histidine kinase